MHKDDGFTNITESVQKNTANGAVLRTGNNLHLH